VFSDDADGRFGNSRADTVETLAAIGGSLAAEWLLMILLWRGGAALAFLGHLVVSALLDLLWRRVKARGGDERLFLLLAVTTPLAGPIGPAGVGVTMVLGNWFARRAQSFEDWYESLFPVEETDAGREVALLVKGINALPNGETNVLPLNDILSFGSFAQKQAAVTLMTKYYRPDFAPALHKALSDETNAIRVQAATAMAKIESEFLERSMRLAKAAAEAPDDPRQLAALAAHHDAYAFSGVLDPKLEEETRQKAVAAFRRLIELEPENIEARSAVGRLLVRQHRFAEAADWYGRWRAETWPVATRLWHAEALYALGRYADLRTLSALTVNGGDSIAPKTAGTLKLWAGEAA